MKFHKLIFEKIFELERYQNEKIGEEIILDGDEDADWHRAEQIRRVEALGVERIAKHRASIQPHIETTILASSEPPQEIQIRQEPEPELTLAEQINTCTDLKVLESYRLLITKDALARTAYNKRKLKLETS
jgi:hypothetical protein